MKKKVIKKIISFFLIVSILILSSCQFKSIDYNIEIAETKSEKQMEFSFEKPIDSGFQSKIVTKADKNKLANEEIKVLISKRNKEPRKVKGIYLPAYVVGDEEKFNDIFNHIINSEINTIVVDVKDEVGRITFDIDSEFIRKLGTIKPLIKDVNAFLKRCKEHDIYVIARVTSFLDNFATKNDTSMAIIRTDGKHYRDNTGSYWLSPYNDKVKQYLIEIGKGCAKLGFDEVQYDYFRFSADRGMKNVEFSEDEIKNRTKIDVITELAQDIYKELIPLDVFMSIDVFGAIISSYRDQNSIGQEYVTLMKYCDYICPMLYPSHYANKTFGLEIPDFEPYKTILYALNNSTKNINEIKNPNIHYGIVRPWLQGFSAVYLTDYMVYDAPQYLEQIKAVNDANFDEWMFWQAGGSYKWDAFESKNSNDTTNNVDNVETEVNN